MRGEDARVEGDVLVANRELFLFDFGDFNTRVVRRRVAGAAWRLSRSRRRLRFTIEAVDTIYDDYVRPDGSEIEQQLKLRIVPITATVRVLPLGRHAAVQPYVGGGIGIYNWRYSETGDFIDFSLPAGRSSATATRQSGTSSVRSRCSARGAARQRTVGGEVRYQKAEGDLDELDFLGPKIDLGGFHYLATFGILVLTVCDSMIVTVQPDGRTADTVTRPCHWFCDSSVTRSSAQTRSKSSSSRGNGGGAERWRRRPRRPLRRSPIRPAAPGRA